MSTTDTYNTGVYPQEWETKLQERLNHPTTWNKVAKVIYTNSYVLNLPYMPTANEPVVSTQTRGTAYTYSSYTLTNNTLTVSSFYAIPIFIDRADIAQMPLFQQMEAADLAGIKINEYIESAMLADFANWTAFGDTGGGVLGLASTAITVSPTNVDDIIRGVKRECVKANGLDLFNRNGGFIVWRPADFEMLEAFAQANGFITADSYLKDGLPFEGFRYMNMEHYQSNDYTAGHIMGGVKGLYTIGILKDTYGQVITVQDPLATSGVGIITRVDYGLLMPVHYKPLVFNINVN